MAVTAYHQGHNGQPPEGKTWQGIFDREVMPWLLLVTGLYAAAFVFEVIVGILHPLA